MRKDMALMAGELSVQVNLFFWKKDIMIDESTEPFFLIMMDAAPVAG